MQTRKLWHIFTLCINEKKKGPATKTRRHKKKRIRDWNVLVIGICKFDIIWDLRIKICDFSAVSMKANRFYLHQFEPNLTQTCQHLYFI